MPELDDAALERRLRGVLQEHLGALPLDLTVDALDRRREAKGVARRSGRGRSMTLLAAAALLLVGGALAAGSGLLRLPSVVPPAPEPSVIAVATASPNATSPTPSESAAPSASPIPVAGPGGVWIPTGTMVTTRSYQMAVRLLDGRVLVIGGQSDAGDGLTSAELYDPATGTWSATGDMLRPPGAFPATLLRDGTVLVGDEPGADNQVQGAQVYDPATGTWSATGKMVSARFGETTATMLRDGKVLVVGYGDTGELYDPDRGTWTATGKLTTPRHSQTAIVLSDGKVLVAGGHAPRDEPTDAAELYDPDNGTWTAIANMQAPHETFWATLLLPDGKVLVMSWDGSEVYDPTTGTWTARATPTEIGVPNVMLSDGTLMTPEGGPDACAAALYDPRTGSLTTGTSMVRCPDGPLLATLLLDGTVLVAGGMDCNDENQCISNGAAELYVPTGVPVPPLPAFASPPPPVFPSPTPRPTPFPAATGPVPPDARSWKVTVDNDSSEPVTLFVAEFAGMSRLVGSATPNVVPAGATVQVTFLFPDKGDNGWIYVNPRPGEGGGLVSGADIGIPGKIWIREDGEIGWLSP